MNPKEIAELFHDTYEKLAPDFGYETRKDTKEFDPESPNGKLMIAVCSFVCKHVNEEKFIEMEKEYIATNIQKQFSMEEVRILKNKLANIEKKLKDCRNILIELKHQNHHTIEEEMWIVDKVLQKMETVMTNLTKQLLCELCDEKAEFINEYKEYLCESHAWGSGKHRARRLL